jgi:hypothetical protein
MGMKARGVKDDQMKGILCACSGCNFWAWALAGLGLEEPGVQDVCYEICVRCTALRYDDESLSSFAPALWKEIAINRL